MRLPPLAVSGIAAKPSMATPVSTSLAFISLLTLPPRNRTSTPQNASVVTRSIAALSIRVWNHPKLTIVDLFTLIALCFDDLQIGRPAINLTAMRTADRVRLSGFAMRFQRFFSRRVEVFLLQRCQRLRIDFFRAGQPRGLDR